uniref:CSN8_PSD8_EIF3K domain-containing protein n=1 Tax=Syphacia muris TaxID=451379 RepID=A0A0N5AKY8_9BILA
MFENLFTVDLPNDFMAEASDVVLCLSSNISNASFEQAMLEESDNDRNLPMDADDSLATASASVASPLAEFGFLNENISLLKEIENLKQRELLVACRKDSNFYSALVAHCFASFNWQKIKMCRMRIEALFNPDDRQLGLLIKIARNLEEHRFGMALKICKELDCKTSALKLSREIMFEVQERLQLYVMLLVQRSYNNIEIESLAEMLDIPVASLPQLLNRLGWSVNSEYVYPIMSQEFVKILEGRKNSLFGEISLNDISEPFNALSFKSFDEELEYLANFIALMES